MRLSSKSSRVAYAILHRYTLYNHEYHFKECSCVISPLFALDRNFIFVFLFKSNFSFVPVSVGRRPRRGGSLRRHQYDPGQ